MGYDQNDIDTIDDYKNYVKQGISKVIRDANMIIEGGNRMIKELDSLESMDEIKEFQQRWIDLGETETLEINYY